MNATRGIGGAPTKYNTTMCKQVKKLCYLGMTDKEIANFFEVSESAINIWKREHREFFQSIREGRENADANVSESLYKRALGYEHEEDVIFNDKGKPLIIKTTKHYPPDSHALRFWLMNRRPKNWRDKQEVEHSGTLGVIRLPQKKPVGATVESPCNTDQLDNQEKVVHGLDALSSAG